MPNSARQHGSILQGCDKKSVLTIIPSKFSTRSSIQRNKHIEKLAKPERQQNTTTRQEFKNKRMIAATNGPTWTQKPTTINMTCDFPEENMD